MERRRSGGMPRRLRAIAATALLAVAANAVAAPPGTMFVSVENEQLTTKVVQVPLRVVLSQLGTKVPLKAHGNAYVLDQPVSVSVNKVPLREGIARLLRGTSFAIIENEKAAPRFEIILLAKRNQIAQSRGTAASAITDTTDTVGSSQAASSGTESASASPDELKIEALIANDPAQRVKAMTGLSYAVESKEAQEVLSTALADQEPSVRMSAMELIKDTVDSVPIEQLTLVARSDQKAELRMQALSLLAERAGEEARSVLETALADPALEVRELARELINEL